MDMIKNDQWERNKSSFSSLPTDRKILFLSLLAQEITICARAAYPEQEEEQTDTQKLITFNELQHNVTGQLRKMLAKDDKRYPDDTFIDILFGKARAGNCEGDLITALEFAFKYLNRDGHPIT